MKGRGGWSGRGGPQPSMHPACQAVPGPHPPGHLPRATEFGPWEPCSPSGPWRHSVGSQDTRKKSQEAEPEMPPTRTLLGAPALTYSAEDLVHLLV